MSLQISKLSIGVNNIEGLFFALFINNLHENLRNWSISSIVVSILIIVLILIVILILIVTSISIIILISIVISISIIILIPIILIIVMLAQISKTKKICNYLNRFLR